MNLTKSSSIKKIEQTEKMIASYRKPKCFEKKTEDEEPKAKRQKMLQQYLNKMAEKNQRDKLIMYGNEMERATTPQISKRSKELLKKSQRISMLS